MIAFKVLYIYYPILQIINKLGTYVWIGETTLHVGLEYPA